MKSTSYFSLLTLLVMAGLIVLNLPGVHAQSGIELENVSASYRFGDEITFFATIKASVPIQSAFLIITDESQGITFVEPIRIQADGRTEYRLDAKQTILRPFTNVKWNYRFMLNDDSTIQSESFYVRYTDNRFPWQTLESGMLKVNWYNGDANFGGAALEAARSGIESIRKWMSIDLTQPIEIFIYANSNDLHDTLVLGGEDWVAGHADPALGVAMVAIDPGVDQSITLEQRIPHELMHILLYRRLGVGYQNLPAWLREGTATLVELYPNADYDHVLSDAATRNQLIPLKDLCNSFPAEAGQAFLAYTESRSFTKYLHDTYGASGLLKLTASYADGVDCEHGTESALGVPLSSLETRWRSSVLGQNTFLSALQNSSQYFVLLCLVLIIPFIGIVITLRKRGSRNESGTNLRR